MTESKKKPLPRPAAQIAALASDPFSGLTVGDEIPPLTRGPVDRVRIARFAGALEEWSVMNLDDAGARAAGMPQVFAQPMLAGSWCAQMLTDWLQGGRVVSLDLRFVKLVWPGDTITSHGRVQNLRREGDRPRVEVDLWAENQRGELVIRGLALCELKPGAVLLRPPPVTLPRKAPPPPLPPPAAKEPPPPDKAPAKASTPKKKASGKSKSSTHTSTDKPTSKSAAKTRPTRLAAKRTARKGKK